MANRVLVVDDDEAVRFVTAEMLKHMDCDVCSADSGRAALERLGESEFDLVLLDLSMPIMTGAEVFAEIQSRYPEQRVVFMTGYSKDDVAEFMDSRTSVLAKPFTLQVLKDTVGNLLDS